MIESAVREAAAKVAAVWTWKMPSISVLPIVRDQTPDLWMFLISLMPIQSLAYVRHPILPIRRCT